MKPVTAVNRFTFIHYNGNNRRNERLIEGARLILMVVPCEFISDARSYER